MTSLKLWLRRAAALVTLLIAVAAGVAACTLALYMLPLWTARISLIVLGGLAASAAVTWVIAWLDARLWSVARRARFAVWVSALLTVACAAAMYVLALRPSPLPHRQAVARANTKYWTLTTGSRIAYSEYDPPAGVAVRPEPIVFLHGGPGAMTFDFEHAFYGQFEADGFRVYLFDQAGSGLSDYLPHVRDYTLARSIADLEAVRQQIGASKMILIGHSFGSALAANYMAKYPEHVAKVVFHSPGPMWSGLTNGQVDYSRTAAHPMPAPSTRLIAALLLFQRNPDAAENLLPQAEAADLFAPLIDPGTVVCKGTRSDVPVPPGNAIYPLTAIDATLGGSSGDPRPRLRTNHTPAILVYGACDFLQWSNVLDYRNTLPNLKVYFVPHAGHYIQVLQPVLLARIIRGFLLDQPDTIPAYTADTDPRPKGP